MLKDIITNPANTEAVLQWFIILIILSLQAYILQKSLQEGSNRQAGLLTSLGIFGTFLGICVGYQAIFERSDEFNSCASGLGIFKGSVIRFPDSQGLKIPQIGWNQIDIKQPECPIYKDVDSGSHVYFVHSFYPELEDESIAATYTDYGVNFVSSIWKDNIFATQFHPEKSQRVGLKILENFVNLAR